MKKRQVIKIVIATLMIRRAITRSQFLRGVAGGVYDVLHKHMCELIDQHNEKYPDSKITYPPARRESKTRNPRITYNNPVRSYAPYRRATLVTSGVVVQNREEAELVLEQMVELLTEYQKVSVKDLYELTGIPPIAMDYTFGWTKLEEVSAARIRPAGRSSFLIDLPSPKPLT